MASSGPVHGAASPRAGAASRQGERLRPRPVPGRRSSSSPRRCSTKISPSPCTSTSSTRRARIAPGGRGEPLPLAALHRPGAGGLWSPPRPGGRPRSRPDGQLAATASSGEGPAHRLGPPRFAFAAIGMPAYTRLMPRSMWRGASARGWSPHPGRMYLANESKGLLRSSAHGTARRSGQAVVPRRGVEVGGTTPSVASRSAGRVRADRDEELEQPALATTRTSEILEFCDDSEIDAGSTSRVAYYLEPEAVGVKPYQLLRKALRRPGRWRSKVACATGEHLCRLRPSRAGDSAQHPPLAGRDP